MKHLAVFIDGTWNLPRNNTNVWRINLLTATHNTDVQQLTYYHQGVGVGVSDRMRGAFGKGINGSVRNCYEWVVANYCPGDQLFIFGFSRGAYVARSLVGFIERCGLLKPGTPMTVKEVFERYRMPNEKGKAATNPYLHEDRWPVHCDKDLQRYSQRIGIAFLGVWDTVRYYDLPLGSIRGVSRSQNLFHAVQPSATVRRMCQALAIDEHRLAYKPELLFVSPGRQNVEGDILQQRWFPGSHSNVGGGYRRDTLALLSLSWMQEMAAMSGLQFKHRATLYGDEHLGDMNDSFDSFLGGTYRKIRLNRRYWREIGGESVTDGGLSRLTHEVIDGSIFRRWREDSTYRPKNVAEWARRHSVSPDEFEGGVDVYRPLSC